MTLDWYVSISGLDPHPDLRTKVSNIFDRYGTTKEEFSRNCRGNFNSSNCVGRWPSDCSGAESGREEPVLRPNLQPDRAIACRAALPLPLSDLDQTRWLCRRRQGCLPRSRKQTGWRDCKYSPGREEMAEAVLLVSISLP